MALPVPSGPAPSIRLAQVVLDTDDVDTLATFWAALLGGTVTADGADWRDVEVGGRAVVSAQLAPDHEPPQWPDGRAQQVHLDLAVDDIAAAHAHAVGAGAVVLEPADGPDPGTALGYQVYADPAGHPFCLVWGQ